MQTQESTQRNITRAGLKDELISSVLFSVFVFVLLFTHDYHFILIRIDVFRM